jgi:RNA polymerase sigma factor (sigma-70 family)
MSEDAELLRRYAVEHSEAAFTELIRRYVDLVYSAALRLVNGDAHRAQDVTQQVFTEFARQAKRLMRHPAPVGWLYTTTRLAALRVIRTEQRRSAREQEATTMNELLREPTPEPDWDHLRPVLEDAMHELGEKDRHAVLLRFFQNKSLKEVGMALGLGENAARMRVERALEKLRAGFLRRGIAATTALASVISANAVQIAPAGLAATLTSASHAAAGTATLTLLKFMTMTKLKLSLGALVVAGATTVMVVQHQTQEKLRAENTSLRRQTAQLEAENGRLTKLADRPVPSEPPSNELLRLRGQVVVMQRQNQELARLLLSRQKTTPASTQTGDFESSSSWTDAGNATPEAAAQTFSWASRSGNQDKLAEVLMFESEPGETNGTALVEELSKGLQSLMSEIEGSRLILTENPAPDEVTFWYQSRFKDGQTLVSPLTLKRVGDHWKVKLVVGDNLNGMRTGREKIPPFNGQ